MRLPQYAMGREEDDYVVVDNVLYTLIPPPGDNVYPRVVVPIELVGELVGNVHAHIGHQGLDRTLQRVQETYKWPYMRRDVFRLVRECGTCALHQVKRSFSQPGRMPIPSVPGEVLGIDMIGPMPMSPQGNKHAIVIIDHCSGWAEVLLISDRKRDLRGL